MCGDRLVTVLSGPVARGQTAEMRRSGYPRGRGSGQAEEQDEQGCGMPSVPEDPLQVFLLQAPWRPD
jgi:hypothetical protein